MPKSQYSIPLSISSDDQLIVKSSLGTKSLSVGIKLSTVILFLEKFKIMLNYLLTYSFLQNYFKIVHLTALLLRTYRFADFHH